MRRGLPLRIAATAMLATTVALAVAYWTAWPRLRARALEHTRTTLLAEARLASRVVAEALARGVSPDDLDPLIDQAARDVEARITVIAADGRVVADSAASGNDLRALENHGSRPEVKGALLGGSASATRHSATLDVDQLYVAVPVERDGRTWGVARVALALSGVYGQAQALRDAVTWALGLSFVVTVLLSAAFSSSMAGPINEIMQAAREFGRGNLGARIRVGRDDELGELARILNQSADDLEKRVAELAGARARTAAILASMDDGVLVVDHRGMVLMASDALTHTLDVRDAVGRHYLEVVRQREVAEAIEGVLATGERRRTESEFRAVRRTYAITTVPFPSENDRVGALATFHDVTERKRIDQVRRDFVANASHELRTPLTSIRGFVEALEDGALQDSTTAVRFLGKIRTHADRMAVLIQDLLELSRLESGEYRAQLEPVALGEVVDDVVASLSAAAAAKGLRLARGEGDAPPVSTDADHLRRILESLADNAVKYTPAGGAVELRVRPAAGGGAAVDVSDNGPGIPAQHLPRIFERFYRVDKARSRELGGTGLGLSIARHLAHGMGASISVTSELGKGTCFTVSLPASPPAGARLAERAETRA